MRSKYRFWTGMDGDAKIAVPRKCCKSIILIPEVNSAMMRLRI
jgi:hypothetical protein